MILTKKYCLDNFKYLKNYLAESAIFSLANVFINIYHA